jgi:hypothetical protein
MFLGVKLIGEDVADNAFFVDDVGHSTRQYAHGCRDAIRFSQSPLLIAQKQERKVVMWSYHLSPGTLQLSFRPVFPTRLPPPLEKDTISLPGSVHTAQ